MSNPPSASIFRQSALARLSNPEQLDQLTRITPPQSWLALLALGALIVFILFWSWFGRIPVTLSGGGMLVSSGGLFDIEVIGQGSVARMFVAAGDAVEAGELIAEIDQPDLVQAIKQQEASLARLDEERATLQTYWDAKLTLEASAT
ncbi:MAG: hypothetical protein ACTS5G_03465, partial [Burkholderiales bacterium]